MRHSSHAALSQTLHAWKSVDFQLTNAHNEAKDTTKYLSQMEKHTDVLYSGSMPELIEVFPALLKSVRIVQELSRHYNDPQCTRDLLLKVAAQVVRSMVKAIRGDKKSVWEHPVPEALRRMEYAGHVHDSLMYEYTKVQNMPPLNEDPSRHPAFEFHPEDILGEVVQFQHHLVAMRRMLDAVLEYDTIAAGDTEGFEAVIERYQALNSKLRSRPYNFLDSKNPSLANDLAWFMTEIDRLDDQLVQYVNSHFELMPRTSRGLQLIQQFERTLIRSKVQADLGEKLVVVFHNYGLDLDVVQRLYERNKFQPPLIRNTTQVAPTSDAPNE